MSERQLMSGCQALAEGAVQAGCRHYFGFPTPPQGEILAYMARRLPEVSGIFVQAESEAAAIGMTLGGAAAGARVLTSSSGAGISLMQEGISYLCALELPCVIANVMRAGPGSGGLFPAQEDYFQAVYGGGHGDYRMPVLAPSSPQEMHDLTLEAFALADRYRNPAMILADLVVGQMQEAVQLPPRLLPLNTLPEKPWAVSGSRGRARRKLFSHASNQDDMMGRDDRLWEKYRRLEAEEVRWEVYHMEDAEWLIVAFGMMARQARQAVDQARQEGVRVGLLRPITLWPFPTRALSALANQVKGILVTELNHGQMVHDVRLAVEGRAPVQHFGWSGRLVTPPELVQKLRAWIKE